MLPTSLDWDETTGTHDVSQERADIVREMFRRAAVGDVQDKITRWLNGRCELKRLCDILANAERLLHDARYLYDDGRTRSRAQGPKEGAGGPCGPG
jgi:hypothetical protein